MKMNKTDIVSPKIGRIAEATKDMYIERADDYAVQLLLEQCPSLLPNISKTIPVVSGVSSTLNNRAIISVVDKNGASVAYTSTDSTIKVSYSGDVTIVYVESYAANNSLVLPKRFIQFYIDWVKLLDEHECKESTNQTYESWLSGFINDQEEKIRSWAKLNCSSNPLILSNCGTRFSNFYNV